MREMTETKKLTKDRNYYRMMSDAELVGMIKGSTSVTELEIVLAERLKKAGRLHHI
jgi:hypothetical protein